MSEGTFFETVNMLIMIGVVATQVAAAALLLALLNVRGFIGVRTFVARNGITLSTLVLLAAVIGSLFYSSIAGFAPCVLCWYQRIFLYPQLVFFIAAYVRKTRDVVPYTMLLSGFGVLVALYQAILERLPSAVATFCYPSEFSASCTTIYIEGFNYITIPIMSLSVFILLLLIGGIMRKRDLGSGSLAQ